MEQKLIDLNDIKVGDEIIISCNSWLKYLKVLRIPKNGSTRFKCSVGEGNDHREYYFQMDCEKHTKTIYQDLYYRNIFLVKRENND
jgi:hypothetical protein